MALHKNAGDYREATRAWLRARFGTGRQNISSAITDSSIPKRPYSAPTRA
jgi:hypothetical protein